MNDPLDKTQPDWRDESEDPSERGWYAVKRADGSLCIRGWGNGMWWIPLKDGWMSGIPAGFKWLGPLAPIEWNTPAERTKDRKMSSEAYIQASVVGYARKKGVLARKLDFGQGFPDYMLLYSGVVLFIEFKATNGHLTVLQEHVIKLLREQDFTVEVCDNVAFGEKVVDQLVTRGILLRQRKPSNKDQQL